MDIIIILDYRDEHTNLTLGEEERERERKKINIDIIRSKSKRRYVCIFVTLGTL